MIPGGRTPILPAKELQAMGFAAVAWPNAFTYAYAKTATELADAVDRAQRAVEIGADYAFLEAPEHVEQMRQISRLVKAPSPFPVGGSCRDA
jgi:2-methylisocitrate lyase-like PEP mutase family enzyme